MTFQDWWGIGARLLGTYLLVLAGLHAAGALGAFGIGLPDGSNRLVFAGIPVLQGLVAASGGLWLMRASGVPPPRAAGEGDRSADAMLAALQLLGIFFLVTGAAALFRVLIDSYFVNTDWEIRSADLASGAIETGAGALMAFAPMRIAEALNRFGRLNGRVDR